MEIQEVWRLAREEQGDDFRSPEWQRSVELREAHEALLKATSRLESALKAEGLPKKRWNSIDCRHEWVMPDGRIVDVT